MLSISMALVSCRWGCPRPCRGATIWGRSGWWWWWWQGSLRANNRLDKKRKSNIFQDDGGGNWGERNWFLWNGLISRWWYEVVLIDHNRSSLEDIRGVQLVREIRTTVPAPWCQLLSHQPMSIWFICLWRLSEKEMLIQHFKIGLFYKPGNFVYKVGLEIDFLVSILQCLEKKRRLLLQSFTDMSSSMKTRSSEMNIAPDINNHVRSFCLLSFCLSYWKIYGVSILLREIFISLQLSLSNISVFSSFCLFIFLSFRIFIFLSFRLFVYLSICHIRSS